MPPRRRLTVALVVTGRVADEIDGLRRALGANSLARIAPHCTLIPPVNVREEDVASVLAQVRSAAASSAPIAVTLGPPGTFWPKTPVLHLAVGGDLEAMEGLRDDLAAGLLSPPSARRERPFVPHVTLDQRIEPDRLRQALDALADYRRDYCFERVTVLEQDAQSRWQPLADAELIQARVAGRGTFDLELSVVDRLDPVVAGWAAEQWEQYSRECFGEAARLPAPYAIVARSDGRPVGVAEGEVRGSVCRLEKVLVDAKWRNQGVGSHLLRAVERLGLERGCTTVTLEAFSGGRAQQFCADRGFVVTATLPNWRQERDFVLMERRIDGSGATPAAQERIEKASRKPLTLESEGS